MTNQGHWSNLIAAVGLWLALLAYCGEARAAVRLVPAEYPTIQAAVDACAVGDTVLLSPGVYQGVGNRNVEFPGFDISIISRDGPEATTVDCQYAGRGFYLDNNESRTCRIEGLTIRNGNADVGAAVYALWASPTIANCVITDNETSYGGALCLAVSDGLVEHCTIVNNYSGTSGGGILNVLGGLEVTDCLIAYNYAAYDGGGVSIDGSGGELGTPTFTGCTIVANSAGMGGGIMSQFCTIVRCVVWANCGTAESSQMYLGSGVNMFCSDVDTTGVYLNGEGTFEQCLFTDPLFCAPVPCSYGDWTLRADSPCLPEHSPCGALIGALDQGCGAPVPEGACCLPDGSCLVAQAGQCQEQHGTYMGDGTTCEPNPCVPTPVERTTWGKIKRRFM